ncbi:MAG: DeoR/GlpR transcriptional regulator [Oscillospiraceae bacterium]|nr:DeoR/GlpR transcriptional regulator [Oscillospiraceae bacterium]
MQPHERHDIIIQMLSAQDAVTIPELMNTFGVSIETVRRDLNTLEQQKRIRKVYGGAILYDRVGITSEVSQRMTENITEKMAIGQKCAELVNDGDTLYLGPGTTVLHAVKYLREKKNLTIITNSLHAATELLQSDATIFFIGGRLSKSSAHTEQTTDRYWDQFCPPKAIVGASGISNNFGVTDFGIGESQIMNDLLSRAANIIVLADNSKFGVVHAYVSCPLSRVSRIITGSAHKAEILRDFSDYSQRFLFVDTPSQTERAV